MIKLIVFAFIVAGAASATDVTGIDPTQVGGGAAIGALIAALVTVVSKFLAMKGQIDTLKIENEAKVAAAKLSIDEKVAQAKLALEEKTAVAKLDIEAKSAGQNERTEIQLWDRVKLLETKVEAMEKLLRTRDDKIAELQKISAAQAVEIHERDERIVELEHKVKMLEAVNTSR